MSNFLPLVKRDYTFEEDNIKATFNRMTREQMLIIMPYLKENTTDEENVRLVDVSISILEKNMVTFTGLKDSDNNDLEFSSIAKQSYFTPLLSEICLDLINESQAEQLSKKEQIKKLKEEIEKLEDTSETKKESI